MVLEVVTTGGKNLATESLGLSVQSVVAQPTESFALYLGAFVAWIDWKFDVITRTNLRDSE